MYLHRRHSIKHHFVQSGSIYIHDDIMVSVKVLSLITLNGTMHINHAGGACLSQASLAQSLCMSIHE